MLLSGVLAGIFLVAVALLLRVADGRADAREAARLLALAPSAPLSFDPAMVEGLPEVVRRYFRFVIAPGTPLVAVADLRMRGQFGLGTRDRPRYQRIRARQILAAFDGFLWAMETRSGLPLSGSDSASWTRFRIFGLFPIVRAGGTTDHRRSAFGRYAAEALFWAPAALLPSVDVRWDAVGADRARVTIRHGDLSQQVELRVEADGRPSELWFQRWSNANPGKRYRLQPFGGRLSGFRQVQGYCVPHIVEAGNLFGTDEYFPSYRVQVEEIRFPLAAPPPGPSPQVSAADR